MIDLLQMKKYKVNFVDVGITIEVEAVLGEIAVSIAEKQLQGKDLGRKVNLEVLNCEAI